MLQSGRPSAITMSSTPLPLQTFRVARRPTIDQPAQTRLTDTACLSINNKRPPSFHRSANHDGHLSRLRTIPTRSKGLVRTVSMRFHHTIKYSPVDAALARPDPPSEGGKKTVVAVLAIVVQHEAIHTLASWSCRPPLEMKPLFDMPYCATMGGRTRVHS